MCSYSIRGREKARRLSLQALYSWLISGNDINAIESDFLAKKQANTLDVNYFRQLLHGIPKSISELDGYFKALIKRPFDQLDPIELTVLRIATYELLHCPDIPHRVIINEALELTKTFGGTDGHKFVNGVLDKMVKNHLPEESSA